VAWQAAMRNAKQQACAKAIEDVAADASHYLSKSTTYDNIIALVWDDLAQTAPHAELKTGLEAINGVSAAIVLPRPSKMQLESD
jgi:DpnII restriction endonuclease